MRAKSWICGWWIFLWCGHVSSLTVVVSISTVKIEEGETLQRCSGQIREPMFKVNSCVMCVLYRG